MSNLYRGPTIDASYQVSFHLAKSLDSFGQAVSEKKIFKIGQVLVGSIFGRSSIKTAHLILVSDWLISKKNLLLCNLFLK
jgi:hypothetical protein